MPLIPETMGGWDLSENKPNNRLYEREMTKNMLWKSLGILICIVSAVAVIAAIGYAINYGTGVLK